MEEKEKKKEDRSSMREKKTKISEGRIASI